MIVIVLKIKIIIYKGINLFLYIIMSYNIEVIYSSNNFFESKKSNDVIEKNHLMLFKDLEEKMKYIGSHICNFLCFDKLIRFIEIKLRDEKYKVINLHKLKFMYCVLLYFININNEYIRDKEKMMSLNINIDGVDLLIFIENELLMLKTP